MIATVATAASTIPAGLGPVGLLVLIGVGYAIVWLLAFAVDDIRGLRAR